MWSLEIRKRVEFSGARSNVITAEARDRLPADTSRRCNPDHGNALTLLVTRQCFHFQFCGFAGAEKRTSGLHTASARSPHLGMKTVILTDDGGL